MPKFVVKVSQKRYGSIIVEAETSEDVKRMWEEGDIDEADTDPDYDDGSEELVLESVNRFYGAESETPIVTRFLSVTDLETEKSLSPDGYGDEWTSTAPTDDEAVEDVRTRAALFHSIPIERISAYVYTTDAKD